MSTGSVSVPPNMTCVLSIGAHGSTEQRVVARNEVGAHREGFPADRDRSLGRQGVIEDRKILEIRPAVAGGEQAELPRLRLDVRRRLEMIRRADLASHHRIVGEDVESSHEVRRRDRGGRRLGRVLERQRLGGHLCGGDAAPGFCAATRAGVSEASDRAANADAANFARPADRNRERDVATADSPKVTTSEYQTSCDGDARLDM